jgi:hypothetical protein
MKTLASDKTKSMGMLFGALALIAFVTITPHAFAITYTDADNPHGPMESVGWAAGMAVAAALSGVGIFTAVQYSKRH